MPQLDLFGAPIPPQTNKPAEKISADKKENRSSVETSQDFADGLAAQNLLGKNKLHKARSTVANNEAPSQVETPALSLFAGAQTAFYKTLQKNESREENPASETEQDELKTTEIVKDELLEALPEIHVSGTLQSENDESLSGKMNESVEEPVIGDQSLETLEPAMQQMPIQEQITQTPAVAIEPEKDSGKDSTVTWDE